MKANILLFLFFSLLFLQITPAQNVEPQFSELKGFEDPQNTTHLFYRIYQRNGNQVEFTERNDIYRLNTVTLEDTFFLEDGGQSGVYINYFRNVDDYDFWSVDSLQYVYCLTICATECSPFIAKSDTTEFLYGGNFGAAMNISIGFNSDIIYCGLIQFTQGNSIKSLDGGYTWQALSEELIFCSLSPFDDDISFYLNENGSLFKSIDGGTSFYEIDSTGAHIFQEDFEFHFDSDQSHIYTTYYDHPSYYLSISNNFGEPNSWQIKRSGNTRLSVSNNPSQTGEIYLAEGETIYKSTDFGDTFEAFNTLDDDIIDIYKKPDSDKLYAATKYRIYEVTAGSVSIIKQLQPVLVNDLKNIPPDEFVLHQNYPNPFNPVTSIQYAVGSPPDGKAGGQKITLKVYDVLGNEVTTLVDEYKSAGSYEVSFNASALSSGVYFYRLSTGNIVQTKKMILLR